MSPWRAWVLSGVLRATVYPALAHLPLHRLSFAAVRRVEATLARLSMPTGITRIGPPPHDFDGVKGYIARAGGPSGPPAGAVLYLHGGAFVVGHPQMYWALIAGLARHLPGFAVYAIEYRKAPAYPFPASLDDCLTAYRYLLEAQAFPPKRVVLMGDSAGGNLAFALVQYCLQHQLPLPAGVVGLAPWLDPALPLAEAVARARKVRDPMLPAARKDDVVRLYLTGLAAAATAKAEGATGRLIRNAGLRHIVATPEHPFVSPLRAPAEALAGHPPVCIHAGTRDFLLQESRDFIDLLAKGSPHTPVQLRAWEGLPHVFQLFPAFAREEAAESLAEVARFIEDATSH